MRILVAGASGFVGTRLTLALQREGHQVLSMTRAPGRYHGPGRPVAGNVLEPASLPAALRGCTAAYYLVHSLGTADFESRDAAAARHFARAAADAGLRRIIYLGGLGDDADQLSVHLRSRRAVERILGSTGVPVASLRAGVIVGHGGVSWEMTRQLVENLPAMITPNSVHTRTQPIAIADVLRYLLGVLTIELPRSRAFDIGGADVLPYLGMLRRLAVIQGRMLPMLPVPLLGTTLYSYLLTLLTDVDLHTGRALLESMDTEVVVRENSIRELVPFEPADYDTAVLHALGERARAHRH